MYPKDEIVKMKHEKSFRTNTPVRGARDMSEYRREDIQTKVKGIPREPFIPSHVPKYEDIMSEDSQPKAKKEPVDIEEHDTATVAGTISEDELSRNTREWTEE
jgi:hypothetical protein